jgi:alkylation response protein AidB-like acyl-CoA dehydrogenase
MFELTPEQRLLQQTAREFAREQLAPYARERDRAEGLPRSIVDQLGQVGFLGLGLPASYGGTEVDELSYCLVVEELGRGDSSVRGLVTVSLGLVAKTILRWGGEAHRTRWLPRLATGRALGCFALTEPAAGSDAAHLQTRATATGDGWEISGSKLFITNGTWADVALVFARTGPAGSGAGGVSCFVVPTDTPGFTARPIKGKLGLRAQDTAELVLDRIRLPRDALLGEPGGGFTVAMSALDRGRISLAAGCVGLAQAALDAAVSYATQRHAFGKPIARHQLIQRLLSTMDVEIAAARLLTYAAAVLAGTGKPHTVAAARAKLYASQTAVRATGAGLQVFGGYGYIDEFPAERLLRDARVTTLYEGTSQIQQLLIGRSLTGMSAV